MENTNTTTTKRKITRLVRLPKGIPKSIRFDHNYGRQELRLKDQGFPEDPGELLTVLEDPDRRREFVEAMLEAEISVQVVRARVQRNWSQKQLADQCGWAPTRVSSLESAEYYHRPSLETIITLAQAFGVGVEVRFVPMSRMLQNRAEIMDRAWLVKGLGEEMETLRAVYPNACADQSSSESSE